MPQFVTNFIPVASIFGDSRLFLPFREWIITMLDERFARLRTHRNNIARYRGLLKTILRTLSASSSRDACRRSSQNLSC